MDNKEFNNQNKIEEHQSIPLIDIIDQITELICYYYKIFRADIPYVNPITIRTICEYLLKIYPYTMIYDIQIMDFPYESYYFIDECTELIYGKYRIRQDIMNRIKQHMIDYWKNNLTSYNARSSISVISISNLPFDVPYTMSHTAILSIMDLYQY